MRPRIPISIAATVGVAGVIGALSCSKPTQARLSIALKSACATTSGPQGSSIVDFVVYVGPSLEEVNAREARRSWVARMSCAAITADATLVLYPETTRGAVVRVVAGVKRVAADGSSTAVPAESCETAGEGGCIRATRSFQYVANETLELPISLDVRCAGVFCDTPEGNATCVQGACVSDTCPPGLANCTEDDLPRKDASVRERPDSDAEPRSADASVDAPLDGSPDATISFPPVLTFSCVAGEAGFANSSCEPQHAECYSESFPNEAVCGKAGQCQVGVLPCCTKRLLLDGVKERRVCCLAKNTFYPVTVPKDQASAACDERDLCFPNALFSCGAGSRVCVPIADGTWGYCSP